MTLAAAGLLSCTGTGQSAFDPASVADASGEVTRVEPGQSENGSSPAGGSAGDDTRRNLAFFSAGAAFERERHNSGYAESLTLVSCSSKILYGCHHSAF